MDAGGKRHQILIFDDAYMEHFRVASKKFRELGRILNCNFVSNIIISAPVITTTGVI